MQFIPCPKCGEQISAEVPACPFCGLKSPARYQQAMAEMQAGGSTARPGRPQQRPRAQRIVVAVAVAILALSGSLVSYFQERAVQQEQAVSEQPATDQTAPADQLTAEQLCAEIAPGWTIEQVEQLLGRNTRSLQLAQSAERSGEINWTAQNGCAEVVVTFENGAVLSCTWREIPC